MSTRERAMELSARDFLIALFGTTAMPGFLEIRFKPRRGEMRQRFFRDIDAAIAEATALREGADVYFGAALRSRERGGNADVLTVPAAWADLDFKRDSEASARKRLAEFQLRPSAIVETGGGLHLWWLFREPAEPDARETLARNRSLQAAIGADEAACDMARVLRFPGSLNFKYDPPREVGLVELNDLRYNPSDFDFLQVVAPNLTSVSPTRAAGPGAEKPWDDFNLRMSWGDLLGPHGWRLDGANGEARWTRPGKEAGTSATTGHVRGIGGDERLHVFTSSAPPFKAGGNYSKIQAHALLNFGGDMRAACRDVSRRDFGTSIPAAPEKALAEDTERFTDTGNAARLVKEHGENIRYCYDWRKFLAWDGRRWKEDALPRVERLSKKTARGIFEEAKAARDHLEAGKLAKHAASTLAAGRLGAMIDLARCELEIEPNALNSDPWLFNCMNGTLDLRTGELRPHRREDLLTKLCPVQYDPNAAAPTWERFLDKIMGGNAGLIAYLSRTAGYSLTGDVREDALFLHHGTGANGKTTYFNALRATFGPDYAHEAAPELLMSKRGETHPTEAADLFGRRLVTTMEVESGRRLAEVMVKRLTGRDAITARRMREDFWSFMPTHKIFLSCNHRPVIEGTDQAIWRRIRLLPFNVTIPEAERDTSLGDKLREELPGILAWAVRGSLEWQRNGLADPPEVLAATAEYKAEMDVLGEFISECCVLLPTVKAPASKLYDTYLAWNERSLGGDPITRTMFGTRLGEREFRRDQNRQDGNRAWWHGIGLRDREPGEEG